MLSRRRALTTLAASLSRAQGQNKDMFADAVAYERFMGRWSSLIANPLLDFAHLPGKRRVLDVGSGTGSLAIALAKRNPDCEIVGIDVSKQYVEYARSRNPFPQRATFSVGDAQHLDFAGGAFDDSLSLLVFNFIPDSAQALREVTRVTRPGGAVVAAVWDYGAGMQMLRAFWDTAAAVDPTAGKKDEAHMPLCHRGELANLWRQGGLDAVEEKALDIETPYASFADYWDPFLLGQGPAGAYVRSLDAGRRDRLRAELKGRLSVQREDAPITLTARAWAVRGRVPRRG
ncbi:MAG: class I SAM-dependent methyltransferase [Bryobacteraceae bacterium]